MATTTPNFGWPVPTSTDLVKDGATAMEALGDAIDTSMVDLKGGTTGQVLAKASNTDMDFNWVAQDDSNAIQNTIVDAKGDLIAASAADTPARLAVGNNGETLVGDSSTSTGLRWQGNYAAGKNKIINGDFGIWQRGTSFTPSSGVDIFCADRFSIGWNGTGTTTVSRQTFTPGTAPVAGYEGSYYLRAALSSGATYMQSAQKIEDVRTFAGQTITISYWAKASSSVTMRPIIRQDFGSGGSASVDANLTDTTFTTSWTRYSWTTTLASLSGKTIGTNSSLIAYFLNYQSGTIASNTIDVWGLQIEASSTATAFQTATGTIQGELAACQRYYFRYTPTSAGGPYAPMTSAGTGISTTQTRISIQAPVTMRVPATTLEFSTIALWDGASVTPITSVTLDSCAPTLITLNAGAASGLTQYRPYFIISNNSTSAYLGIGAEL